MQTARLAPLGRGAFIPIDTERTYTESHPRFTPLYKTREFRNKNIDILSSPLIDGTAAAIKSITCRIGKWRTVYGIRIEIVVHVYGIYIIAGYYIIDNLTDKFPRTGHTGIEKQLTSVNDKPLGVSVVNM